VTRAVLAPLVAAGMTTCCRCLTYERTEIRPGEAYTPAMLREHDCPAADPRLESSAVLPDWIELHAIGVELPDEAAA
jgi:hypothetical protein